MSFRLCLMGMLVAGVLAVGCGDKNNGGVAHPTIQGSLPESKKMQPKIPSAGGPPPENGAAPTQPGKISGTAE